MNDDEIPRHIMLKIEGIDCPDCALTVKKNVSRMPHVKNVKLDFDRGVLEAEISGGRTKEDIESQIRKLGYSTKKTDSFPFFKKYKRVILTVTSGILAALAFTLSYLDFSHTTVVSIYVSAITLGGYYIAQKGLLSARLLTFDMNFLMSVAVIGACLIGEWSEGASVVFLFSLAQLLESYSVDKARGAIKSLMNLAPPTALVRRNGEEKTILANEVEVGETIIIKPGERIALDGTVEKGYSHINQSLITGESMPAEKKAGDRIFAGSINNEGILEVQVSAPSHNTTLARIITLVEKAQARKAPMATYVERFARIYTPIIISAAFLVALLPPLFQGKWELWFYRALVLLVISCPCALVISTPVTIVSALASSARQGVLVKGGLYLESMNSVNVIAFDKTGTLTRGEPSVTDIVVMPGFSEEEVLLIAASCEHGSEHPFGKAIVRKAKEKKREIQDSQGFMALSGQGVKAEVEGRNVIVGNRSLMVSQGIDLSLAQGKENAFSKVGKTPLFIALDGKLTGIIAVADTLKENSVSAIEELKREGTDIIMLTGDNNLTAAAIAEKAGVDSVISDILPEDKAAQIEKMQAEGNSVAMVGDGINDGPALAQADVGIAMGAFGSDIAIETADIALMSDDISKIPYTKKLSGKTMTIIKQNIFFAIAVKVIFFILALAGIAALWSAVFADMGASLIVIANGLRLLKYGKKHNNEPKNSLYEKNDRDEPFLRQFEMGGE